MKYIIDMPEIKRCVDCDFDSYEDGKHFCSIEQSINLREINTIENIHQDCPLKPLKVKQLEWEHTEGSYFYFAKSIVGFFTIVDWSDSYDYLEIKLNNIIVKNLHTLAIAKEFCQQHYENMIFSAMED